MILTIFFTNSEKATTDTFIPELKGEGFKNKNRAWTLKEAQQFAKEYAIVQKNNRAVKIQAKGTNVGYADGNLHGFWENKGPYNMPGAFQFCEMDEGTDTIYAVTCGHYGGVQFIWKGTLTGDDWKLINPKDPTRFDDVIVLPQGNGRRVIAGRQQDRVMYTDNAGTSWEYSTGLTSAIKSTIVNRQRNNIIYSTDGRKVFTSTDNGTSFQEFQDFGSNAANARLYSPRWAHQPGASDVYLVRDARVYKLNGTETSFTQTGTVPINGSIAMAGDARKLWIVLDGKRWHASTDEGNTFSYVPTTGYWFNDILDNMDGGQFVGVNPEDPDVLIGGYSVPIILKNGGSVTNADARNYWGFYQNAVGNDAKVRNNYHPDFQSSQFFYDGSGNLMTLRSSDGGVFISYNEWTKNGFPTYADMDGIYYNISLFNKPSQETYRGGFMHGYLNPDHLSSGTQDQGWQDTRATTFGDERLYWDQIGGGDGPSCITGDGKIGWAYNYQGTGEFRRIQLYNGNNFRGQRGTTTANQNFSFTGSSFFTPSVGDWEDGNRIWVLSQTLRRIEYNTTTTQITAKEDFFGNGNSFMQGIAQSRANADIVYAMRNGNVHKSTNRGDSWSQIASSTNTGISGFRDNRGMGWSSPLDPNIVLFATQSGTNVKSIFSIDGGSTWEDVTGTGANRFPTAEVNGMAGSKDGNYVFASTNMGPYVFTVSEKKWYPLATDADVPLFWGQIVYCVDYGDKEVVHFSTWGQGIWDFVIEENITTNDVLLSSLDVPSSINCTTTAISPSITIRNKGAEELTSLNLKVYVNDVLKETVMHTTSLTRNESQIVNLPTVTITDQSTIRVVAELPNNEIDENPSNNELTTQVIQEDVLPQEAISIIDFSTQELTGEGPNNGQVIHLLDGDATTFWHSQWTGGGSTMPHELVFDLTSRYDITSLRWLNRSNNNNGNIQEINIYVSDDIQDWGTPTSVNLESVTNEQLLHLATMTGRYLKIDVLSNFNGNSIASIAELNIGGCSNQVVTSTLPISTINENSFQVYPIPATDILHIKGEGISYVEIVNSLGKVMNTLTKEASSYQVNISTYTPGTYFVRINVGEKQIIKKVIKK